MGHFNNVRYYAILDPNGGTVTKQTNYGTVTISYVAIVVDANSDADVIEYNLPIPKRDGYTFDGWYVDNIKVENSGTSWNYTENVKLVAHWTPTSQ